jgi:drug/metabolite transporter (DMT)-like permease
VNLRYGLLFLFLAFRGNPLAQSSHTDRFFGGLDVVGAGPVHRGVGRGAAVSAFGDLLPDRVADRAVGDVAATHSVSHAAATGKVWALGLFGLFGYHFLYFTALRNAPAVEAGLIAYLWPLLIVVGSACCLVNA